LPTRRAVFDREQAEIENERLRQDKTRLSENERLWHRKFLALNGNVHELRDKLGTAPYNLQSRFIHSHDGRNVVKVGNGFTKSPAAGGRSKYVS
jgi:hypothetical protein